MIAPLYFQKGFKSILNLDSFYKGVPAGSFRALIEDAVDREGKGVVDTAGQVSFAGNGDNHFRFMVADNLSGQSPAGGDGDVNFVTSGKFDQGVDITPSALLAVVDIGGDPALAVGSLETVRQEQQHSLRSDFVTVAGEEKAVVGFNERVADLLFADA